MLSESDIRERLRNGSLAIFPLGDRDVSPDGISIRIGTDVAELRPRTPPTLNTLDVPQPRPEIHHIPLGERFVVRPNTVVLVPSLQVVTLPSDLTGFLLSSASVQKLGLSVGQATIGPSFTGKLTLTVRNMGQSPVALYAGLRIATLSFFQMTIPAPVLPAPTPEEPAPEEDVRPLRQALVSASEEAKAEYVPATPLAKLLDEALSADKSTKGKRLESFATEMLRSIEGLKIIRCNAQLRAEELDLLVQNDLTVGFWRTLSSPFIVECKNWSAKVGASEIAVLENKLASLGKDTKTAILLAPSGITGDSGNDAWLKVRELRQRGIFIIVLDSEQVDAIRAGQHPVDVIEQAYQRMWLV